MLDVALTSLEGRLCGPMSIDWLEHMPKKN